MIEPTVIDRVLTYFAPERGLSRMHARAQLAASGYGGYESGRRDRRGFKRWRPAEASADADILPDLPDLRSRSRDLARNIPIASGAIATGATNVIGDGLQLQAAIDHEALGISAERADAMEREQEREWALFCRTCDFTSVQHFNEMQELGYRGSDESGDIFFVRRFRKDPGDVYGTKLQIVEADRVSNPDRKADSRTLAGGIEVNGDGVHVAYHVTDRHPGDIAGATPLKWERIAARTGDGKKLVLHLYKRLRPDQTRGVPYLAPVIALLKQLGDYTDAEVRAAVVSAMYTVFVKSSADGAGTAIPGEKDGALAENELKLGSGAVLSLRANEDVTFADPSRPNEKFDPFVLSVLRQIGVGLELPFELLVKHFTASYSASRAALEMAWQFFRKRRAWVAGRLCHPAYEWMMEEAVASGRLNRPGFFEDPILRYAYLGGSWIGPARISLDPLKEANADKLDIELRTKTREQICLERTGGEWQSKTTQLAKEEAADAAARAAAGLGARNVAPAPTDLSKPDDPNKLDDPNAADDTSDDEDETDPKRGAK